MIRRAEARTARAHTIIAILVVLWSYATAFLIMLNDIDFFSIGDLYDPRRLHHEHIVFVLFAGAPFVAAFIFLSGRRNRVEP